MGNENTVNLEQAGAQSRAGKAQGEAADTHHSANRNLAGKLEPMDREFRGQGGTTFGRAAVGNLEGGTELGRRLAELALGAVLGEKAALQADEAAGQDQQTSVSASEESRGLLAKPITS